MNRERHRFEIVVIGAGPAGLAAACAAAEAGRTVAVLEASPWPGGQIWRGGPTAAGPAEGQRWSRRLSRSGARLFCRTTAFAAPAPRVLLAEAPGNVREFSWQKLILAPGARELFLPFPGWTLPGVLGPGGLHALAKAGWPVAGRRVVVAGSGPLLLAAADGLKRRGAHVCLIAEQAPWSQVMRFGAGLLRFPEKLLQGVGIKTRLLTVPYRCGAWAIRAEGAERLEQVTLTDGSKSWTERCDYLACAFNLVPNDELPRLLGCATAEEVVQVDEFQETTVQDVFCAGEPTGVGGADCALVEGQIAGLAAAGRPDQARDHFACRARWHRFRRALSAAFSLRPELRQLATPDTVVCRCEDVRRRQLEPYDNWRAAKLHTRCGMGACQGRTCGSAIRVLFGWHNESLRPPLFPVTLGALVTSDSEAGGSREEP
jgi:D-hydroxyproline dehydrogenase subunit alpha